MFETASVLIEPARAVLEAFTFDKHMFLITIRPLTTILTLEVEAMIPHHLCLPNLLQLSTLRRRPLI